MEAISDFFAANPTLFKIMIIIILIFAAYLVFKQFLKLTLLLFLIAVAGAGYHYYNNPQKMSEYVHKFKSFYQDSKDLINKTKKVPGDINKLLKNADDQAGK
jgi:hypothetical protein